MTYQFSGWKYATADNSLIDVTVTDGETSFPFTYGGPGDGAVSDAVYSYIQAENPTIAAYEAPPVAGVKATYSARIDADAERERLKYITPGAGMAITYQEKFANAQAVDGIGEMAANALSEAERDDLYPVLSASVGIEAATLWDCAQLVIARYEAFADIGRGIERARLAGKKAISDASTVAEVEAAYGAITWPTPS